MPLAPSSPWLAALVDYAGLFPPANLDLPAAIAAYDRYRRGPLAPMLGRFIVPADSLPRLVDALEALCPEPATAWQLSVLVGGDLRAGLQRIDDVLGGRPDLVQISAVEALGSPAAMTRQAGIDALPDLGGGRTEYFFEVPWQVEVDPRATAQEAQAFGVGLKIRTGGVSVEAIPPSRAVARFLQACSGSRIPFKATAGLHHPLAGDYPLTYEPDSPRGRMHGFLGLFAAAAMLWHGRLDSAACEPLIECDVPPSLSPDTGELLFGQVAISRDEISEARELYARSFGSCSFEEPVADLRALGLLGDAS